MMKIFKKKKILSIFHDAGGANIGLNYIKKKNLKSKFYCKGPAYNIFKKIFPNKQNVKNFTYSIRECDFVITGTSSNNKTELKAIDYCKKKRIFCVSFLDHWVNYKNRFVLNDNLILPNLLISSDKYSYRTSKRTFKKVKILQLKNYYEIDKVNKIKKMRQGNNLLYFLEPINNKLEFFALKKFFRKLERFDKFNQTIILRLHPSEKKTKYHNILKKYKKFKITLDVNSPIENLIASAKYIFGLESNALVLSSKVNKKVFTILPLYNRNFRLPFKKIKNINTLENLSHEKSH